MEKYYQTDGIHSYLVFNQIETLPDSYEIAMISNNDFSELLSFQFRMLDNQVQMYYQIDGLMEMNELKENDELECKYVMAFMDQLIDLIFKLYDYLISPCDLILELDRIFYSRETQTFHFLYFPGYSVDVRIQITELVEKLLRIIDHKERIGVDFIYGLYELVRQEHYDLEYLRSYIKSFLQAENKSDEGCNRQENTEIYEEYDKEIWTDSRDECIEGMLLDREQNGLPHKFILIAVFGMTILAGIIWTFIEIKNYQQLYHVKPLMVVFILMAVEIFVYMGVDKQSSNEASTIEIQDKEDRISEAGDTTVLSAYEEETILLSTYERSKKIPKYRLVHDREHDISEWTSTVSMPEENLVPITIDTKSIILGRNPACCDHCISDDSVSRKHARIYREEGRVILEDMNSTNGTYVNDFPVLSGQPAIISEGDVIRFGSISYYMTRESQ